MVAAARYLDVILVLASLPFVVVAELPLLGYAVGAGGWIAQRGLGAYLERRARAADDPRTYAGVTLAGVLGRAWLLGLTILAVGLAGAREDGAMAAALVLAAFTVYFAITLILRPERNPSRP